MLRGEVDRRQVGIGLALCAVIGALAAALVVLGNPGNMGLCGACFLRDDAAAIGLVSTDFARIFRPEVAGLCLGALGLALARRRFVARSGSFAITRFVFGAIMGLGALVFLGCPFRMLQRLGGGDGTALAGLGGFIAGVGLGVLFERRGYSVGKTSPSPAPVGLLGAAWWVALLALFLAGALSGPGPGDATGPAHAPWMASLGIALLAGALLSATGFCAVSAARQVFQRPKRMLLAALILVAAYAVVMLASGRFRAGFDQQPVAHADYAWSFAAMVLVGLCGCLCGGCPVRQIVMSGEGNGDAFVTTMGLVVGGALAHNLAIASSPRGTTPAGRWFVAAALVAAVAYAAGMAISARRAPAGAP